VELVNSYGKPQAKRAIGLGAVLELQVKEPDVNRAGAQFALEQVPEAQAALIAIDPMTGGVRAMVGGYDFRKSQFNRAMQAKRNPGSAFKPVIYAAALEHGMTTASIIDDSQVEYESGGDKAWKPKNYDNVYRGPVTMREALTDSINVVSVKILERIGVGAAIDYAKKLGIASPLAANLTLALGSSSVTPMELTSAYAVFASGGYRTTPYFVTKVLDRDGNVLEEVQEPKLPVFGRMSTASADPASEEAAEGEEGKTPAADQQQAPLVLSEATGGVIPVIPPETAFIMTNLMESVVTSGTGGRARAVGRPVAGKTGTTNDMKDAWFVGYVPQLVAGVWVGYDQERSLGSGGSGGQAAAPIWTEFMQRALAGVPVKSFPTPGNVTFALIDPRNGHLAREGTPGSVQECFVSGTEPTSYGAEPAPESVSTQ
jgi:penicillin-binding protein 1A